MNRFFTFVFAITLMAACAQQGKKTSDVLPAKEFADQLKADPSIVLIDVRTPDEMKSGYIAGAINMDYNSSGFQNSIASLDHNKKYFVYCAVGKRSGKAMEMMKSSGFKNVTSLEGGLNGWKEQGLPVEVK